jgi:hypothetical protein
LVTTEWIIGPDDFKVLRKLKSGNSVFLVGDSEMLQQRIGYPDEKTEKTITTISKHKKTNEMT